VDQDYRKVLEVLGQTPVSSEPEKMRSTIQRRSMPYEGSLMLGQIDQARDDLYGINEDLAVIQAQLALLPTPGSPEAMARLTLPTS
jgi:hypothetical protein